ncbi:MarR family transcriptional regulator [Saccharopolyspora sp. WRP15-2]|uniref:MarR family transcriptional regulator n=2 Tax=Saccharopolyspora TaxID=1835 RepID=A0ABT4V584_9PSEU|nr:MarR family transcriptional regulator [Saccharopolyspora oryzae]MDA3629127.1 MarR family transcriptional regulator [Saccharopolyspora oryzae]
MARLREHLDSAAADVGLSLPHAHTLLRLEQPERMGELAATLHCEPSHVTAIADLLQAEGLLERQPDPADRRAKLLVLTAKGEKLRERLLKRLGVGFPIASELDAGQRDALVQLLRAAQDPSGD